MPSGELFRCCCGTRWRLLLARSSRDNWLSEARLIRLLGLAMSPRFPVLFVFIVIAALAAAGCGGPDGTTTATGASGATGQADATSSGIDTELGHAMMKSSNVLTKLCAKVDAGAVKGADKPYGVGPTKEDIQRSQGQLAAAVDDLVAEYNSAEDPGAKVLSQGATARSLLRAAQIQMRVGCGPDGAKYAIKITEALESR
jgi:hypothetical protein